MKKILFFLLLSASSLFLAPASRALDPVDVPIASASAILDETKKEILKKALDKNLKNTQGILGENANRNLLVGYVGIVIDIKQGVFNLTTDEANLQVSYDTKTAILKDGKSLKPELISLKDKAIVIGSLTSPDILTAKRIVIASKNDSVKTEKKVIYSPIIKIKNNILTLKIDNQNQDVALGKKLKLDPKTLTTNNKVFGILLYGTDQTTTLVQVKIF